MGNNAIGEVKKWSISLFERLAPQLDEPPDQMSEGQGEYMVTIFLSRRSVGRVPCEADTWIDFSAVPADVSLASKLTYERS
jgi:hypothetical protein